MCRPVAKGTSRRLKIIRSAARLAPRFQISAAVLTYCSLSRTAFASAMSSLAVSSAGESSAAPMRVTAVRKAQVAHPTGDKSFSVMQPFPAAVSTEESDPYLMCDLFGPTKSSGVETNPDRFPVDWHPHREGRGRHADSLGNRESFNSPGMQWISVGSGIEHAEAGGTPAGLNTTGFQIWVNVPSARKMEDPRYGTVAPERLPLLEYAGGVTARLVSGSPDAGGAARGPFESVQPLLMMDVTLPPGAPWTLAVPPELDNAMAFVYRGAATVNGAAAGTHEIALLDASAAAGPRGVTLIGGPAGAAVMLFAGKRLNQPVAWRGPFVMTTQAEIASTIAEYRAGAFPPKRVPWDYTRLDAFPAGHPAHAAAGK